MESLDRKFLGEDNSLRLKTEQTPELAETGITQRLESGTAQPEKVYIKGSAVPNEIDENDPDRLAIMESLDRKFLGEDNSFKGEKDNLPKIAETGMTQRLESGTAQPEEVYIIGSAVPDEIDEIESPISSLIDEREPKELKLPMKRGVDQEEQKKVYRLAPPQYVQTPEGELFQLPMNRGFHDWCSFKYGDLIYNSREIFPGPLWVIGSDHSEGCGLIVADESGIEIIPYRYGVLWPSQRLS